MEITSHPYPRHKSPLAQSSAPATLELAYDESTLLVLRLLRGVLAQAMALQVHLLWKRRQNRPSSEKANKARNKSCLTGVEAFAVMSMDWKKSARALYIVDEGIDLAL